MRQRDPGAASAGTLGLLANGRPNPIIKIDLVILRVKAIPSRIFILIFLARHLFEAFLVYFLHLSTRGLNPGERGSMRPSPTRLHWIGRALPPDLRLVEQSCSLHSLARLQ